MTDDGSSPREIVASIREWWSRQARASGLSEPWTRFGRAFPRLAPPVEEGVRRPELEQMTGRELADSYVLGLTREARLQEGRHFTPAPLAETLWEEATKVGARADGRVVDPAAGAGSLLLPPLRAWVQTREDPIAALEGAPRQFAGTDTDRASVWLGNIILAAELLPLWREVPPEQREPLPLLLTTGDGLEQTGDDPDVVILNPPYGRITLTTEQRERWSRSLYGHANRFGLFLHASLDRVVTGGSVAALIPTSFLGGAYSQRLRAMIAETAPLARLTFIDERSGVFHGGVLQETCLAIFHKGSERKTVHCSRAVTNGELEKTYLGRVKLCQEHPDLPWLLPRQTEDLQLVGRAAEFRHRLPDYGWQVSTGPLVWNRYKPQISSEPRDESVPILWAADIADDGTVRRHPSRDDKRWFSPQEEDRFMILDEPAVLVQRTTAPEQPRRLVAAVLDRSTLTEWGGEVIVENHVNVLRCTQHESVLGPGLLGRLLNANVLDRIYRCLTGTVAVSAYELEALPLPPPELVDELADRNEEVLAKELAEIYEPGQ